MHVGMELRNLMSGSRRPWIHCGGLIKVCTGNHRLSAYDSQSDMVTHSLQNESDTVFAKKEQLNFSS